MRLNLYPKLLLLMLVVAILPLAFLAWLDYRALRDLGERLSQQTADQLTRQTEQALMLTTANYVQQIKLQREILELLVKEQAEQVRRLLFTEAAADEPRVIIFDTDIDAGRIADLTTITTTNPHSTFKANYHEQAFRLPPNAGNGSGTTPASGYADEMARLASMTSVYQRLNLHHQNVILRHYTTLASGLHSVFPGRGGYPPEYDPRQRPWYTQQVEQPGLRWSPPLMDVITQEVTFGVAMPIISPDSALAGVTAIDVPIAAWFNSLPVPSGLAATSRTFAVKVTADSDDLLVLYKQHYQSATGAALNNEVLRLPSAAAQQAMLADMRAARSGWQRDLYAGEPAFFAYRPIDDSGTNLLLIVPSASVMQTADQARQAANTLIGQQLADIGIVSIFLLLLVAGLALMMGRAMLQPIETLTAATAKVTAGDLQARADVTTGDEFEQLAQHFNAMLPRLREQVELRESIRLAREVQQHLIPKSAPQYAGMDVCGLTLFCEATGGDYYDYFKFGEGQSAAACVVIGDVSGHGISSALLMTSVRALLHSHINAESALPALFASVNRQLTADVQAGRFMSLHCLAIYRTSQQITWVDAGHGSALLYRAAADQFVELASPDIPLGIDPKWEYHLCQYQGIQSGDVIFMGSDGVWEMRNEHEQAYGKERIREFLRGAHNQQALAIRDGLFADLKNFRGSAAQHDDTTVVIIKIS